MKKLLLLLVAWLYAFSIHVIAGQGSAIDAGKDVHEAKFIVLDHASKKPIVNAGLYNVANTMLGSTDNQGWLTISLPASTTDKYTLKSDGYNPLNIRLTHAERKSAEYEVFLQPAGAQETVRDDASNPTGEKVKVYVKQDPSSYQKTKNSGDGSVEYAVQLSASSRPITDKNSLKSWEELGHVFIQSENGMYKVRIGPFYTQEDAKAVLLKVKARGKSDAWIVVQKGRDNHEPFDPNAHHSPLPATDEPTPNEEISTLPVTSPEGEYKVRLASYLKPGAFNPSDVEKYGPLESYRKGEWTIMLIGGFKTEKDAMRIKDIVVSKGYNDAAVVVDHDGILEEIDKK